MNEKELLIITNKLKMCIMRSENDCNVKQNMPLSIWADGLISIY